MFWLFCCFCWRPFWGFNYSACVAGANGALDTLLQQARESGQSAADFGPRLLVSYAAGIASAMQYLSSLGFVHRDLAARNALVDSKQQARLADFGLSRRVDDANGENAYMSVTTRPLPMRWMAPEAIELKRYNTETDVWAYGVLVWEVRDACVAFPPSDQMSISPFLKIGKTHATGALTP